MLTCKAGSNNNHKAEVLIILFSNSCRITKVILRSLILMRLWDKAGTELERTLLLLVARMPEVQGWLRVSVQALPLLHRAFPVPHQEVTDCPQQATLTRAII